jgi:hypothetical protein
LLSSSADEVQRLIAKAKDWTQQLAKPVQLWMSDKQDAFVKGIEAEFKDVPHRYCQNHFLRDLAKPMLEKDSHQKVQMRKKVRGLRDIEKQVLEDRRQAQVESAAALAAATVSRPPAGCCTAAESSTVESQTSSVITAADDSATASAGASGVLETAGGQAAPASAPAACATTIPAAAVVEVGDEAGQVVLDYCAAVRGILNDDQGGPLHPPGIRMAEALQEVSESLARNLEAKKGGAARSGCASSRAASRGDCKRSPRSKSGSRSMSRR